MQEHEYKARDKTVQKMSRDGLREENLRSKKEKRITRREADEKKTAGHREQELDFGNARKAHTAEEPVEEGTEGKHRLQSRHAFLEQEKIAEADEMENSEMSEDKADGEKSPSVSRSRLRKESIRGHPGQDAERDSETPVNITAASRSAVCLGKFYMKNQWKIFGKRSKARRKGNRR